ncbi:MAG: rhomboid family intramembrane serine protease [Planctomycetota bacterium]|nr:MAG: rhomboid family intramembrane serine protease [Planctomycetota bacterium]
MLIPYGTDAPVYHFPAATIGLIVASVGVFFWPVGAPQTDWAAWQLESGHGLHPMQWVTCHFAHYGLLHLIGNMLFLWTFGLIVEGKLGWRRFLLLWSVLAIGGAAVLQILAVVLRISNAVGGGASLYVFGLLAVACVWAPVNEVDGLLVIGPFFRTVSLAVWKLAALFVGWNLVLTWWKGPEAFGAVAHLVGAGLGTLVGIEMVRRGDVDCEGWDALSLLFGRSQARSGTERRRSAGPLRPPRRHDEPPPPVRTAAWHVAADTSGRTPADGGNADAAGEDDAGASNVQKAGADSGARTPLGDAPADGGDRVGRSGPEPDADASPPGDPPVPLRLKLRAALRDERWDEAWELYRRLQRRNPDFRLNAAELTQLADGFYRQRNLERAVPLMKELIARFPERSDPTRIALADVMLRVVRKPAAARKLLQAVDRQRLPDRLRTHFERLWEIARRKA